jgi:asparagine synthase (glutamine-hydrolysing)
VIETMCAALRHRGPDDGGSWVSGPVGLGMRRLSVIDPAGSRQPIASEDGTAVIVFNGEVFNYAALQPGLRNRGHRLATQGDTETVLHLYEEMGRDTPAALRGMFAWAIWDDRRQVLTLARDRFGIKPLYYVAADWGIAFASELKALTAAGMTARELDLDAIDAYIELGYIPAPASPFRDVRKLEAGCVLEWSRTGGLRIERYWGLPRTTAPCPADPASLVAGWIDESVATHLVSDVPVAAFLSGGLDSSAVVAAMAANGVEPHAFVARYSGTGARGTDEAPLARALSLRCGGTLTEVDVSPDVASVLERIVYALDEPHADDSAIPTWTLSAAVGASYKVALTGIGGDELFAGYRRHGALTHAERYAALPAWIRRAAANAAWRMPDVPAALGDRVKRFLRAGVAAEGTAALYLGMQARVGAAERMAMYTAATRDVITGTHALRRFVDLHEQEAAPRGADAATRLDYHTFLTDDILALSDRVAMAHSLEIRVPLVDHVLVERVFALGTDARVGGGPPKHLLRRALSGRIPDAHLRAPKRGFVGPTAAWLRGELRPMLEDELSPARVDRLGLFRPAVVDRFVTEHRHRRHNREAVLWALLCFSLWHRTYLERGVPRRYRPGERIASDAVVSAR